MKLDHIWAVVFAVVGMAAMVYLAFKLLGV
jgi:hypothetical protein